MPPPPPIIIMARSNSSSGKHHHAPTSNKNLVEQLRLLRAFVGPLYTEKQLTDALRTSGYTVEKAAETLLLRQGTTHHSPSPSSQPSSLKSSGNPPPPHRRRHVVLAQSKKQQPQSVVVQEATKKPPPPPPPLPPPAASKAHPPPPAASTLETHPRARRLRRNARSTAARKDPPTEDEAIVVLLEDDSSSDENDNDIEDDPNQKCAAMQRVPSRRVVDRKLPPTNDKADDNKNNNIDDWYLLCERWISDGCCTVRNGRIQYRQALEVSAMGDQCVRFCAPSHTSGGSGRGGSSTMHGRLPDALASFLAPLLLEGGTLRVEGSALMEMEQANIGTHIPLCLTVLVNPKRLFQIGQTTADDDSSSRRRSLCVFRLLQWAEYGDALPFLDDATVGAAAPLRKGDNDDDVSPPAIAAAEVMDEADFEDNDKDGLLGSEGSTAAVSALLPSSSSSLSDWARTLPEADDPHGWRGGISLKPYQRQALHWMLQREEPDGGWDRSEWDSQLRFVAELARENSGTGASSTAAGIRPVPNSQSGQDVVCECGPVLVSDRARDEARTWDGRRNPVNHPLWSPRYLATPDLQRMLCVYVNEALQIATHEPPPPPAPCSGGILADSMGLGKTVMLLSLILKSKELRQQPEMENPLQSSSHQLTKGDAIDAPTTTLVVAKLSLLPQWEEEIRSKTSLTCVVYYGASAKNRSLDGADVVITTYGTLQGELSRAQPLLLKHEFLRIILDEAHCVKNHRTLASQMCCRLVARHRWCASGTVFQNSLDDIYGMIKFLRHEPWCHSSFWKAAITRPSEQQQPAPQQNQSEPGQGPVPATAVGLQLALDRVRRLLSPLMLRRTKHSLSVDGTPILTLPPVETRVVSVTLSDREREFYNAVLARSVEVFDGYVESGTVHKSYFQIFSLLQRLRQVCDHISLTVRSRLCDSEEGADEVVEGLPMADSALDPPSDALGTRFLEGLLSQFCKSSPKRRTDPTVNREESPSKRQKENYLSQVATTLANAVRTNKTHVDEECPICLELPKLEDAVLAPCAHIFCRSCLVGCLRDRSTAAKPSGAASNSSLLLCPDGECPCCNKPIEAKRIIALSKSEGRITSQFLTEKKNAPSQLSSQESLSTDTTLARQILREALDAESSSKMTAIFQELDNVWAMDPGSKVLIFSHYLGFLDLLESRLRREGIAHFRLDGSLSLARRMQVLDEFRDNSSTNRACESKNRQSSQPPIQRGTVLLMSMSAGGEGLNLTAASTCFLTSPWWHAEKENQCLHRIHRIGQAASQVRVRKFVVADSVEERIIELQERKTYMAGEIYSDEGRHELSSQGGARLSLEEFRHLFRR